MVQTLEKDLENDPVPPAEEFPAAPETQRSFHEDNSFSYKTVPVIAVVGFVISLLSSVSIFVWLALPLCAIGLIVSTLAFIVIRRNVDIYSGTMVALSGILMSGAFLASGISYQVYTYQTEVPENHQRISFVNDISEKGFVVQNGMSTVHPDIFALDGKQIFLKGYIYQTGKTKGLGTFLLVKDNQSCCFGATPAINDRLGVIMEEGKEIDYKAGKVGVAGTFRLNPKFTDSDLEPLYMLDGTYFTSRVSDF